MKGKNGEQEAEWEEFAMYPATKSLPKNTLGEFGRCLRTAVMGTSTAAYQSERPRQDIFPQSERPTLHCVYCEATTANLHFDSPAAFRPIMQPLHDGP